MTTFYIYEVLGEKCGATYALEFRNYANKRKYNIVPTVLKSYDMPDNEETWQFIGDREWALADEKGYRRGAHYKAMRIAQSKSPGLTNEHRSIGGKASRKMTYETAQEIRSKYLKGNTGKYNRVGPSQHELAKEYNTTRSIISGIVSGVTYNEA